MLHIGYTHNKQMSISHRSFPLSFLHGKMNIWLPEQVHLAVRVLGLSHHANALIMRDRRILQQCCWKFRCAGTWSSVFGSAVHDVSKGRSALETSDLLTMKMKVLQSFETPTTASSIQHYHLRKPELLFWYVWRRGEHLILICGEPVTSITERNRKFPNL